MMRPSTSPTPSASSAYDDVLDAKKSERMLKNRLSAKRSREIAKQHMQLLEQNVAILSRHSQMLAQRLAMVEAENMHLRRMYVRKSTGRGDPEPAAFESL